MLQCYPSMCNCPWSFAERTSTGLHYFVLFLLLDGYFLTRMSTAITGKMPPVQGFFIPHTHIEKICTITAYKSEVSAADILARSASIARGLVDTTDNV